MKEYHVTCLKCGKSWKTKEENAEKLLEQYSNMTTCFVGAHTLPGSATLSQYVYFSDEPFSLDKKPDEAERKLFRSLKQSSLSMFLVEKDIPLLTAIVAQRGLLKELIELCEKRQELAE